MPSTKQSVTKTNDTMSHQVDKLREPLNEVVEYVRDYAREKPDAAMLWCLGIGFVLGWKLKPW